MLEFPFNSSFEEEEDIESENEDDEVDPGVDGEEDAGDISEDEAAEDAIAPVCAYIDYSRDTLFLAGSHLPRRREGGYLFEPSALDTFLTSSHPTKKSPESFKTLHCAQTTPSPASLPCTS